MQRLYSGATANNVSYSTSLNYYITSAVIVIGQMLNNIYFSTYINSKVSRPIMYKNSTPYTKYNLLDNTTRDAILDLLPESWLMYMKNELGYDCTQYIYQYSHDDLVADGIEQS